MIICYYVNPESGGVFLQYSDTANCEWLQKFKTEFPRHSVIEVQTTGNEYASDDAYIDVARHLWDQLSDVPTDEHGPDGTIEQDFLHFPEGTLVYDIWHWFEQECGFTIPHAIDSRSLTTKADVTQLADIALAHEVPGAAEAIHAIEQAVSALAELVANHFGVISRGAEHQDEAFGGLLADFTPAYPGQPCPTPLRDADPSADWA